FVIPERPSGTEDLTDAELMDLVTTESMIGVALAGQPA
ncbi:MAG: nitrile hydratase subunit alpha, partial [Mycolicibacterium sp.]